MAIYLITTEDEQGKQGIILVESQRQRPVEAWAKSFVRGLRQTVVSVEKPTVIHLKGE